MTYEHKPRWTLEEDKNGASLVFADGSRLKLPSWATDEAIHNLARLPLDYQEMGDAFADQKMELERELSTERSKVAILTSDLDTLKSRFEGLGDEERNTRLLIVLQEDLERALNMVLRFAAALGIQRSGPGTLYDEIQTFAKKYGMYYRAPDSAHDVVRNLFPDAPEAIEPPKTVKELPSGEE